MTTIQWKVCLDSDRDLTFDATPDDISAYVMSMNWNNGFASPVANVTAYDDVAPPARATLTLHNPDKHFNPETLGSELLANGNFANWTADNPNSWTVTGESGTDPQVSQAAGDKTHAGGGSGACNIYTTGTTVSISQAVLTSGLSYRVSFTVTAQVDTSGGLQLFTGTKVIPTANYVVQQARDYVFYFNATSSTFKIQSLGACNITIDNVSIKQVSLYGRFLYPGALVRIQGIYNAVTYDMFYGMIAAENGIQFTPLAPGAGGTLGDSGSQLQLVVEDFMLKLQDVEYTPPLLTNVTVDQPITRLIDDATLIYPYAHNVVALFDVQGTNTFDYSAKFWSHSLTNFETAETTLAYTGDVADKGQGVSGQSFIRDLIGAEGAGRLWFEARENKLKFHNRLHDPLNDTIAATYDQTAFMAEQTAFADKVINEVTLNFTSRELGNLNSVVWTYQNVPVKLSPGQVKTFTARYLDPNNSVRRVGVNVGTNPEPGVDFTGNHTERLFMSAEFGASSAKVAVSNVSRRIVYITHLQLRAQPFFQQDETITVRDGDSIERYGYCPMPPKSIRALSDDDFATLLAQDWLRRFKEPFFRIATVTMNGTTSTNIVAGLARVIGDRLALSDAFSGHSGGYVIVGEVHTVNAQTDQHDVTWVLKPLSSEQILIFDRATRDEFNSDNKFGL